MTLPTARRVSYFTYAHRTDLPSLDQAEHILDQGGALADRELRIAPEVVRNFVAESL